MLFIGNQKSVSLLQRSIEHGQINHAYIFSGPEHVGKFTLAKMFALHAIDRTPLSLELNDFSKNALFDLIVISPEIVEKKNVSKQRDISIDSIREVKKSLSLFPYHGKYKILVIEDAHKINMAAQNALLKVLEEPNETSIIILVTHEIDRILPTLQSRSQMVNFGLVNDPDMRKIFSEDIVSLSAGRPGIANLISHDEKERAFRAEALDELKKVASSSLNDRFSLAEEFSKDIVKTLDKLNAWMWEMRKNALAGDENQRNKTYTSIEKIQKSMEMLKRTNANSRLVLETLFMDI